MAIAAFLAITLHDDGDHRRAPARGRVEGAAALVLRVGAELPIMWSVGAGADLMKRIAAPMIGGLVTAFAMALRVYPAIYLLWKRREVTDDDAVTPAAAA